MAKFLKLDSCSNCRRRIDIFERLSDEEMQKVNDSRYEVQFNAGETIFKQGTPFTHVICLTSGLVKVYLEGSGRRNYIIRLARAGEMIGSPGLFTDSRHHFSVSSLEDTTACFIEAGIFRELIEVNNKFAVELLKRSNQRDIQHFDHIISLTQKQMPGRVADLILHLYRKIYVTNPFYLTLTRQDMADMAAITKESLIRILKEFKGAGFITLDRNELKVLNEKVLLNISENG